ncbi:hypothetical protein DFJ77DRAFT_143959 [Powellomyces hirtus]|nr:hypothetical protein DFJ77DRAFT_143959 [Powellomyces hirtus]
MPTQHQNWSTDLPTELIYNIFSFLGLREQTVAARVCRSWSLGFGQLEALTLVVGDSVAAVGPRRILNHFKMLKRLEVRHAPEVPTNILDFTESLGLLPTVTSLTLETTINISNILSRTHTPRLQHLTLIESLTAPCSHLYKNTVDVLTTVFSKQLKTIDLNVPLVMAAEGWEDVEVPVVSNVQKLTVRSLHSDSLRDFVSGFVAHTQFPDLETLQLQTDEAIISLSDLAMIRDSCPALRELSLGGAWVDVNSLARLGKVLSGLSQLRLIGCDLPGIEGGAEAVLRHLMHYMPTLTQLELVQNHFRAVTSPPTFYPFHATQTLTHLALIGFEEPTNSILPLLNSTSLISLRIDNVVEDSLLLASLPQTLRHLEIKFARRDEPARMDSGYATPMRIAIPPLLVSLALHYPTLHTLNTFTSAARHLETLDIQQLNADVAPWAIFSPDIHCPRLQTLKVHAHGTHSAATTMAVVSLFSRGTRELKNLRICATHPFFEASSEPPYQEAVQERAAECSGLLSLDHTNLQSLVISGMTIPLATLPRRWAATLCTLEMSIPVIPSPELHDLLHVFKHLRRLILTAKTAGATSILMSPSTDPEAKTLDEMQALHNTLCSRYSMQLQEEAPWLDQCLVRTDDLRRMFVRRWVIGRLTRRVAELTAV